MKKNKNKQFIQSNVLLNSEQKLEISNFVHEELLNEISTHKKTSEKMIDTLRSVLEEIEIRIGELKRDSYEFKRDVVTNSTTNKSSNSNKDGTMTNTSALNASNNMSNIKINAERILRYYEDKNKQIDATISKLKLKNNSLKSSIHKLDILLAQKEELGDNLHYIDYHQLQIENKQYILKIEEKNNELLLIKLYGTKILRILNYNKKLLLDSIDKQNNLQSDLNNKKKLKVKLESELIKVRKEFDVEKKNRNKLRQILEEKLLMPNVEEYIMLKKNLQNLTLMKKNWEKKVDIMEMNVKRLKTLSKSSRI